MHMITLFPITMILLHYCYYMSHLGTKNKLNNAIPEPLRRKSNNDIYIYIYIYITGIAQYSTYCPIIRNFRRSLKWNVELRKISMFDTSFFLLLIKVPRPQKLLATFVISARNGLAPVNKGHRVTAIQEKRPSRQHGVLLLHDSARPHIANMTKEVIQTHGWESPDLLPTDFHLFRSLSNAMRGVSFNTDTKLTAWLDEFLELKQGDFCQRGIENLVERWEELGE
uniref:Mariner Mos1 transposase n=1 Tax=Heterorhabditis bacteriophora TaxID=37862 RepID=A0A1I7X3Q9_HETBA